MYMCLCNVYHQAAAGGFPKLIVSGASDME